MSRARSKTVDAAEVKKNGLPRRLNEKIALMKKKEQAQSQAFEQAMQSIFEMQQAQLHGGGGSMPSLQNIDSSPPTNHLYQQQQQQMNPAFLTPSLDKSGCLNAPSTVMHHRERPLSGGTHPSMECPLPHGQSRVSSQQTADSPWNIHKSESDLQQSLVDHMTAMQAPPSFIQSPQQQTPPTIVMPMSSHNGHHTSSPHSEHVLMSPNDSSNWKSTQLFSRNQPPAAATTVSNNVTNSSSVSAVLLSPDHTSGMMSNIDPAHIGSASSLPDLTNIEFSSGLDVPIEKDDDSPSYNNNKPNPFHFPASPGTSKLALSSMTASVSSPPSYGSHIDKATNMDMRPHPYLQSHLLSGRVPRSPTMPDFRTHTQLSAPPVRKFKPAVSSYHQGYQTPPTYDESFVSMLSPPDKLQGFNGLFQTQSSQPAGVGTGTAMFNGSGPYSSPPFLQTSTEIRHMSPFTSTDLASPTSNSIPPSYQNANYPPPAAAAAFLPPTLQIDDTLLLGMDQPNPPPQPHPSHQPNSPVKPPSLASTSSSGYVSLSYLDPGSTMYQQRALQQRFANISVFKDSPPLRSHSEENLMKIQKEVSKNDGIIQQNPFMGNMSNASSVPCVYVEPNAVEPCVDEFDSYTTGTGSPSTSASHASSPPIPRPEWIEHPHSINEFVFQDWPLETGASLSSDKTKFGSPLSHHKSLSELNKIGEYITMDLSPNSSSRAHQLSLPSIVMGDLIAMDEHNLEKQGSGPFLPSDFDMEEEAMETLLRNDDFSSFDVSGLMGGGSAAGPNDNSVMLNSSELYQHNGISSMDPSMKY